MSVTTVGKTSLFGAIAIGVGSMIGSGWLFAAYYSTQYVGPASIFFWIIGAVIALCLALLLAEVVTLYQERGLIARLLTISHNRDYGFVVAISNWLGTVIVIASEAAATTQYISTIDPRWTAYIFENDHLTIIGTVIVCAFIFLYGILNYWGMRSLAKANNVITTIKLLVPLLTGLLIIYTAFHPQNFTAYRNTLAPYGVSKVFGAIINSGIFYAFYGFSMISIFAKEIKNPRKNVPIALVVSVLLCLAIYLVLQVAFIGAVPTHLVRQGWAHLDFTSPLAQLAVMLNLNVLAIVLYADAALSPSGTGIVYAGSVARNLTGMAQDKQMPKFFDALHPIHNFSRRSLIFSLLLCFLMVVLFNNWQKIVIVSTVFQLITCIAVPLAFTKLRKTQAQRERLFRMPLGNFIGFLLYLLLTYLLTKAGTKALLIALILHVLFFTLYNFTFYRSNFKKITRAYLSSYAIFIYLGFVTLFGYFQDIHLLQQTSILITFFVLAIVLYFALLGQKNYQKCDPIAVS